jgi:type IV pilus assembly protein PilW
MKHGLGSARPGRLRQYRSRRTQAGFTLIELLIVIAVVSVLLAIAAGGFEHLSRLLTRENVKAGTQQSTRFGVDLMVMDIQLAGLNPLGAPAGGILAAGPTSIQIAADINYDGDFTDPFETVRYALNGSRIEQTNHLGTEALVDNVAAFRLTYFDSNGVLLPDPPALPAIRSVGVSLTLTRDAGRSEDVTRTYSTRIRCRNL